MSSPLLPSADPDVLFAQAPCRADLAGGTYDLWPLYLFHPGAVTVNMALSVLTTCKLTPQYGREIFLKSHDTGRAERFASLDELVRAKTYQHPLAAYLIRYFQPEGRIHCGDALESPAGAGHLRFLGADDRHQRVLARFTGQQLDIEQIRVIAQNVEAQVIKVPTGCQDYYPAMYGGVNAIHLSPGGVSCEPIPISPRRDDPALRAVLHRRATAVGHQQLGGFQTAH